MSHVIKDVRAHCYCASLVRTLYMTNHINRKRTEYRNSFFLGGRGGRLFEGGRLLQILRLRRGANSKRGAYLKLGANSSIYGINTLVSVVFLRVL